MRNRFSLPAFLPDALPRGDVLTVAKNVLPANDGYRSVASFQSVSEPLPAEFRGGASFINEDGTAYLLAGTANGLVRLTNGTWTNLLVALSVTGRWRFAGFGPFAICVNDGVTQEVDLTAGTASALTGAPAANSITVVGDFVVIGQPDGDILRVRWSAFNDHTSWTLGTDQAGDQPMLEGGEVMGLAGGEYGVILQRQALKRMTRTGDVDAPFQFDTITTNYGCASKASIVQAGASVFFLSDRGFMVLEDGQALRPIGNEKFDQAFRAQLGEDDYERLWAAVDPQRTLVMWGIPGTPGTIWAYNWVLDRAATIEMPFSGLFSGFEDSTTLEGLDAEYPDLDALPYSLDDPRWSGGSPRQYFVQGGEIGVLNGPNLPAEIQLGQSAPAGSQVTRLRAVWPDTDAISGVTVSADMRQRKGDIMGKVVSADMQASGRVPLRNTGRYLTLGIAIDDPAWTYIDGFDLEASVGGVR